jgi:hypothetical protein
MVLVKGWALPRRPAPGSRFPPSLLDSTMGPGPLAAGEPQRGSIERCGPRPRRRVE